MLSLLKNFFFSAILFFSSGVQAIERVYSPVLGLNFGNAEFSENQFENPDTNPGFTAGAVAYWAGPYEQLFYRFAGLIERQGFYVNNTNRADREKYAYHALTGHFGVATGLGNVFWPSVGLSASFAVDDECEYSGGSCGSAEFDKLHGGYFLALAVGGLEDFKLEVVFNEYFTKLDSQFKSYGLISLYFHIYPEGF